jgi:uncharacterized protein YbbK (DUF523 family)
MYLVSSCLSGVNCRFNGTNALDKKIKKLTEEGKAITLCPEVLGGLSIPREPCEIIKTGDNKKKVISRSGKNLTENYLKGALITLQICKTCGVEKAILKSRSPSCGYGMIYDGTFGGRLIQGNGVTADLLSKNGIRIFNEENWFINSSSEK